MAGRLLLLCKLDGEHERLCMLPLLPMDEPEEEKSRFVFSGRDGTSILNKNPKEANFSL